MYNKRKTCKEHKILIHAGKISAKTAELKIKEEYKALHLGDISKVGKYYIKVLEDVKIKLLGRGNKK